MTELGLSAEQKEKITASKMTFNAEMKKVNTASAEYVKFMERQQDSVLTEVQKVKANEMRAAIAAENKANPSLKKSFVFDQKVMTALELSADQQSKMNAIAKTSKNERWQLAQKGLKVMNENQALQDAILTPAQKQKVADIKAEIAEYNKGL